ncbi:MAG: hypothetical protein QHC65_14250 [Sphingomonas sp.]|nr:hypothetical protein [Sphingomonas sp.]MDX3885579.1 hypothetical protein [Sphingomonas sp.]
MAYHVPNYMGFERWRPLKMRRVQRDPIRPHYLFLDDYLELRGSHWDDESEAEQTSWPDLIDQTRLGAFCRGGDFEDAEEDDAPGGNITDEPHDAREEDGI